jgi:hypothetical protein
VVALDRGGATDRRARERGETQGRCTLDQCLPPPWAVPRRSIASLSMWIVSRGFTGGARRAATGHLRPSDVANAVDPHNGLYLEIPRKSMRLPETRDLFSRRLSFPTTTETVSENIGDVSLEAPMGDEETIAEVLERCPENRYESADALYDALVTFVGDAYVGRKYYDDRGSQSGLNDEEVSF